MPDIADYVTTREAAQSLGIRPGSVRAAITAGHIMTRRIGTIHLISRREVEYYRREYLGRVGRKKKRAAA